jgi:hypothetical protein
MEMVCWRSKRSAGCRSRAYAVQMMRCEEEKSLGRDDGAVSEAMAMSKCQK